MNWIIKGYEELSLDELYKILRLRIEIFAIEQNAIYQDLDNKDQRAIHLMGFIDDELVAYCRLFKAGDYFNEASIGRVVVSEKHRNNKYGHILLDKAYEYQTSILNEKNITISAQTYLKKFYESHGFVQIGEEYIEDTLPHIQMKIIEK